MPKLDDFNRIENRIREIKDMALEALETLKANMQENTMFFKTPALSHGKLYFTYYSIKIEVTIHLKLNIDPKLITHGLIQTSIYDENQNKFVHNAKHDITVDRLGNIDNSFDKDDWMEQYYEKVIWDLYVTTTDITL